ncbi:MAG: 4-hydroxythreonine-4-phosphate dehydrogenase PdxA [Phycisphaeraceae bacterium]|nr:4-hydroxythreonine-4-phosphate dehydrogenase PdxA [Phycisphaeraceae bacterium]
MIGCYHLWMGSNGKKRVETAPDGTGATPRRAIARPEAPGGGVDDASKPFRPVIGVTMGDPAGIGPEVVIKALADPKVRSLGRFLVFGMNELLGYAADLAEIEPYWWRLQHDSQRSTYDLVHNVVVMDYDEYSILGQAVAKPTKQGGEASLRFLDDAMTAAMAPIGAPGSIDALVTAPICKESWRLTGASFPGHTEYLARRTRSRRVAMMFHSPRLNIVLATVHIPLMHLRDRFTIGCVFDPIDLGHEAMVRMGVREPRIGVCGLNPHASENGQFGDEETRIITPAIEMARNAGIDAVGPFPADTMFRDGARDRFDLIVAMYHDQGLIPMKMLAFDEAVNLTLGLPIIRTSVDHGTAFDIVGKNAADPGSMKAAIQLAARLAHQRRRARSDTARLGAP